MMPASPSCAMDLTSMAGNFGWPVVSGGGDVFDGAKSRPCDESPPESNSCITSSQDNLQYRLQGPSVSTIAGPMMEYTTSQMMDCSLLDWSQSLLPYFQQEQLLAAIDECYQVNSSSDQLKNTNQDFSQVQEMITSSSDIDHLPLTLLQGLLDQQPVYANQPSNKSCSSLTHYPEQLEVDSPYTSSLQLPQAQPVEISNESPFWNPSASTTTEALSNFYQSTPTQQIHNENRNNVKKTRDTASTLEKVKCSEPALKKPRIMAPSPLPTFKVRKEKLGDRITALQQLVSPFGKTDTASVLHEAIDYIKFLNDQIRALSAPYLKNGHQVQQENVIKNPPSLNRAKDGEGLPKEDLRSRGLCLVPISSTFGVAGEAPVDFWASMFGGRYC